MRCSELRRGDKKVFELPPRRIDFLRGHAWCEEVQIRSAPQVVANESGRCARLGRVGAAQELCEVHWHEDVANGLVEGM